MKIFLLLLITATLTTDKPPKDVRILGRDDTQKNGYVMLQHVAPIMFVRQLAGPPLPETGSVACHWDFITAKDGERIMGHCEGGVVVQLTGLDLN